MKTLSNYITEFVKTGKFKTDRDDIIRKIRDIVDKNRGVQDFYYIGKNNIFTRCEASSDGITEFRVDDLEEFLPWNKISDQMLLTYLNNLKTNSYDL